METGGGDGGTTCEGAECQGLCLYYKHGQNGTLYVMCYFPTIKNLWEETGYWHHVK